MISLLLLDLIVWKKFVENFLFSAVFSFPPFLVEIEWLRRRDDLPSLLDKKVSQWFTAYTESLYQNWKEKLSTSVYQRSKVIISLKLVWFVLFYWAYVPKRSFHRNGFLVDSAMVKRKVIVKPSVCLRNWKKERENGRYYQTMIKPNTMTIWNESTPRRKTIYFKKKFRLKFFSSKATLITTFTSKSNESVQKNKRKHGIFSKVHWKVNKNYSQHSIDRSLQMREGSFFTTKAAFLLFQRWEWNKNQTKLPFSIFSD